MLGDDYARIYKRYLKEAAIVGDNGKNILKADCSNEVHGIPSDDGSFVLLPYGIAPLILGNVTCVEIDQAMIDSADAYFKKDRFGTHTYPNLRFVKGDVRDLPFKDEEFDVVLDFSTLDHVPFSDGEKVIYEYSRVMKKRGDIILVVWCRSRPESRKESGMVFYYDEQDVTDWLSKYFDITFSEAIHVEHNDPSNCGYLQLWRGKKKYVGTSS